MTFKAILLLAAALIPFAGFCQQATAEGQVNFPVIEFQANSRQFTPATLAALPQIANEIKKRPAERIVIAGSAGGTKFTEQLSWTHVDAVIEYMSEKQNIDRNSFIFLLDGGGPAANQVSLHVAAPGEDGPSSIPQPHPGITIR